MKVCVLQPDYSTTDVSYKNYDPSRDLSVWLSPSDIVHHVSINKLHTYRQLKMLKKQGYDIFVNLCEGYLDWSIPSVDVIHSLEMLNLPYSGPNASLYDPPKVLMKYIAFTEGIKTPAYVLVKEKSDIDEVKLPFPLFVKPARAGDSLGIDAFSKVNDKTGLQKKVIELLDDYDEILVEEYIPGREFTVLVAANENNEVNCKAYSPVEYIFSGEVPFKTYASKTSELHPASNVACTEAELSRRLCNYACNIFTAFNGVGYARLDFRMNEKGELYFLEINFTCSVFYNNGMQGSADYILQNDPEGHSGFLQRIIAEGIARHKRKQKKFFLQGNAISGYGIYAATNINRGDALFTGEGVAHRIVTRKHVEKNWSAKEKDMFRRYAYPISSEVYILWDSDAGEWAPQNHSCQPNTAYTGLNIYALCHINKGEELTLDYADFLNEDMQPFACNCGAEGCRKFIEGKKGNTITQRELHENNRTRY